MEGPNCIWTEEYTGESHQGAVRDDRECYMPFHPSACRCELCRRFDGVCAVSTAAILAMAGNL
jgi:hypothetical protein